MSIELNEDAVLGCALGALVGDVMGSQSEFMEPEEISAKFGWLNTFPGGPGSDDTILTQLLCDALVRTHGLASSDDWAREWDGAREESFVENRERFFPAVLYIAEKLARDYLPREVSSGSMPSTSSAMAIWPIGVVNYGRPYLASTHAEEVASLIHSRELGFCQDAASAVAAAVAIGVSNPASTRETLLAAIDSLKEVSGKEMSSLLREAMDLADASSGFEDFRSRYHAKFRRTIFCDSRETVPAAFAIALLANGDVKIGVESAVNFGRDTDTIACMVGAITGALSGAKNIPEDWFSRLGQEVVEDTRRSVRQLVVAAGERRESLSI